MSMISWERQAMVRRSPDTRAASTTVAPNPVWRELSFTTNRGVNAVVGPANDRHEREADRMAERATGTGRPANDRALDAPMSSRGGAVASGGVPLSSAVRDYFEPRFGRDFSGVRVHADEGAADASTRLRAKAFTLGDHIWLGRGEPASTTAVMAHELAHVVQGPGEEDTIRRKEDWSFTPTEFGALTKAKGALTFDSDSAWFPDAFKKNLKTTLDTLLDPSRPTAATGGVNTKDFYHGHVAMKGARPADLETLRATNEATTETEYKKALGESFNDVTKKNLPAFKKAVTATLPSATALLDSAAKQPDVVVIYHTFEGQMPSGMKAGSPGRNFITPLGGTTAPYSPPDVDNASSWMQQYTDIYQFSFLIDQKGAIHVRPGSTRDLSTVTGKPER